MNTIPNSCTVAPLTKCNYATSIITDETIKATNTKPVDLIGLALRVLERNQCNSHGNQSDTIKFPINETVKSSLNTNQVTKSCRVSMTNRGNHATRLECKECGYMPPFCLCEGVNTLNMGTVTCDMCKHFNPDKIGDGFGIGQCNFGIGWTQEIRGRLALFRYSVRHCDRFKEKCTPLV